MFKRSLYAVFFNEKYFEMIENNGWLGFDSVETEETETEKKALRRKTLDEIMALYRNDGSMVNISKPLTLSPTIGVEYLR